MAYVLLMAEKRELLRTTQSNHLQSFVVDA